jgi:hypothetical protein
VSQADLLTSIRKFLGESRAYDMMCEIVLSGNNRHMDSLAVAIANRITNDQATNAVRRAEESESTGARRTMP